MAKKQTNKYKTLSNSAKDKRYSYSRNNSNVGYILLMIPLFLFLMLFFMGLSSSKNEEVVMAYEIPTSTTVTLDDGELINIVEKMEELEEEVEPMKYISKDTFDAPIGSFKFNELIVEYAKNEVGNVNGNKFWSYWGYNKWTPWCALFVSWCADQCGYIDAGIFPWFAGVGRGTQWFKERDRWLNGRQTPEPGMLIFFDADDPDDWGPQDNKPDHVGLVAAVDDKYVYCIEGNYNNSVRETKYPIGYYEILGYGAPKYQ